MKKVKGEMRGNPQMGLIVKAWWKFKKQYPNSTMTMKEFFANAKVQQEKSLPENPEPRPEVAEYEPNKADLVFVKQITKPAQVMPKEVEALQVASEPVPTATGSVPVKKPGFFKRLFSSKPKKYTDPEDRRWV